MDRLNEILALLANPADLTDTQLAELETELVAMFTAALGDEDSEIAADDVVSLRSIHEHVHGLQALAGERIAAATAAREAEEAAAAALAAEIAELEASLLATPDPEPEPEPVVEPDPDPAEPAPEPVAVAAGAPAVPAVAVVAARQPARTRPRPQAPAIQTPRHRLLLNGHEATEDDVIEQISESLRSGGRFREKARVIFDFPEDRELGSGSEDDIAKIHAVQDAAQDPSTWANAPQAIVAAGGFCAPAEPIYDYPVIATAARPVRDGLASFRATRGSVSVPVPATLASIDVTGGDAAVGIHTNAEDISSTAKPIMRIACPSFTTYTLHAVTERLLFGNLEEMAFPENLRNIRQLARAAHARLAENELLDQIKAASTAVSEAQTLGVSRDLIEAVKRAAAQIRSRQRSDTMMRAWLPIWALDLGSADLVRGLQSDPSFVTQAMATFRAGLNDTGVNVSFYRDSPTTGTSQILGAQTQPQLNAWPTTIQWGIAPEATFLFLDNGTLDFNVVRDSTLNDTNDAETFYESFEGLAKVGPDGLWVTQAVCLDGSSGAGIDLSGMCGS